MVGWGSEQSVKWNGCTFTPVSTGPAARQTFTYAKSYQSRAQSRRTLKLKSNPQAPALPIGFKRVENDENGVLLPFVMEMLRSLPGSDPHTKTVNQRMAFSSGEVMFVDTHTLPYLDDCSPDITVVKTGFSVASGTALAVLELQVRARLAIAIGLKGRESYAS